jgi:transglutaminase-like putative cysteine protease
VQGIESVPAAQLKSEGTWASGIVLLLVLQAGLVSIAARSIELEAWSKGASTLVPMALLGVLGGFALGRTRVPDLLSHAWAVLVGAGLTILVTAIPAGELGVPWASRVRYLIDTGRFWLRDSISGRSTDNDLLFIAAMGMLAWLVGYASSWFLFRRDWILPAIVLPGMLIIVSVTNGGEGTSATALLFVVIALALIAAHVSRQRAAAWRKAGLSFSTIAWRAPALGGAVIALLAVALVWSSPVTPPDSIANAIADNLDQPLGAVDSAWNSLAQRLSPNTNRGAEFSQFDDQFQMGGQLNLGDSSVAILYSDQPHYLVAQRYAVYNGKGWSSGIEDTFTEPGNGTASVPSMTFLPNDQVFLSDQVLGSRQLVNGNVTILAPKGTRLFTLETYLSASDLTNVSMSWRQLKNEPFSVQDTKIDDIPVELRPLVDLLRQVTMERDASGDYFIADANLSHRLDALVSDLKNRYLAVSFQPDASGAIQTVYVTGQLPVYDDIDAVTVNNSLAVGDQYQVSGLESIATKEELSGAGTSYPPYVSNRYLQLPDSVTQRTVDLAATAANGANDPFDIAQNIQNYLRATYAYDEDISGPGAGDDAVDYFLFDEQRGYCEYFASAMVVMLRSLDVPARIAAGYREVPFDQSANGYLYTEKQAHTWVEVYFPGYGWVPFEPTPAASPFDHEAAASTTSAAPVPTPTAVPELSAPLDASPTAAIPATTNDQPAPPKDSGASGWQQRAIYALVVLLAVTCSLMLLVRRFGAPSMKPGAFLYRRMVKMGQRFGVHSTMATTPQELAVRLGDTLPAAKGPAETIANLYRRETYGGQPLTPDDRSDGHAAWKMIQRSIAIRGRFRKGNTAS